MADAEAICEAVTRPTMRFVPIKSPEHQAVLSVHRARDLIVRQRTQIANMMRGLLAEFGVVVVKGIEKILAFSRAVLAGEELVLPDIARQVISSLCQQLIDLYGRVRWDAVEAFMVSFVIVAGHERFDAVIERAGQEIVLQQHAGFQGLSYDCSCTPVIS